MKSLEVYESSDIIFRQIASRLKLKNLKKYNSEKIVEKTLSGHEFLSILSARASTREREREREREKKNNESKKRKVNKNSYKSENQNKVDIFGKKTLIKQRIENICEG